MKYVGLLVSSVVVFLVILTNFYYNSITLDMQKIKDYILESNIILEDIVKKEDFYKLIYWMNGIKDDVSLGEDIDKVKRRITDLKNEKGILLKENKILKKNNIAMEYLSSTNDRISLENMLKEVERIKNKLISLKKERSNAVSRKIKNEIRL